MSVERATFVREYFERFLSRGNDQVVRDQVADDFAFFPSSAQGAVGDVDHVVNGMTRARASFPDLTVTVDRIFGDDANVAVTWRMSGTHTGTAFRGVDATGLGFAIHGAHHFAFEGDELVGLWDYLPLAAILDQLGISPTPTANGAPRA